MNLDSKALEAAYASAPAGNRDKNMIAVAVRAYLAHIGAYPAHMLTDTDNLLARLRKVEPDGGDNGTTRYYRNPDGPEAADALTSLSARIEALEDALERAEQQLDYGQVDAAHQIILRALSRRATTGGRDE